MKLTVAALAIVLVGCGNSQEGDLSLAKVAPSNEADVADTSKKTHLTSGKHYNSDWAKRFNAVSKSLHGREMEMRDALRRGDWESALEKIDALDADWKKAGYQGLGYANWRAEALIGLDRPKEALEALEKGSGLEIQGSDLTLPLVKALNGSLDLESAKKCLSHIYEYYVGPNPTTMTQNLGDDPVAMVRLARAADADMSANTQVANREALAVLARQPNQPYAAYIIANNLSDQRKFDEARKYWKIARQLDGSLGERAASHLDDVDREKP